MTRNFLLIAGSSPTVRAVVVDLFLDNHKDWKYLALEDVYEPEADPDETYLQDVINTLIACELARDEHKEGYKIIISCPNETMLETTVGEFGEELECVHLGPVEFEEQTFHHVIDSHSRSSKDVCKTLERIIATC